MYSINVSNSIWETFTKSCPKTIIFGRTDNKINPGLKKIMNELFYPSHKTFHKLCWNSTWKASTNLHFIIHVFKYAYEQNVVRNFVYFIMECTLSSLVYFSSINSNMVAVRNFDSVKLLRSINVRANTLYGNKSLIKIQFLSRCLFCTL
jgi:hypothetical protein